MCPSGSQQKGMAAAPKRGAFEVNVEDFAAKTKNAKPDAVQNLDLKKAVPDLFQSSDKVSRTLHQLWRAVMDKAIRQNEGGGIYCHKGGTVVLVYFEKITGAMAKTKVELAGRELARVVQEKMSGNVALVDTQEGAQGEGEQETKRVGGDEALAKVMREGLGEAATIKEFSFWADRITQELRLSTKKNTLPKDLIQQISKMIFSISGRSRGLYRVS